MLMSHQKLSLTAKDTNIHKSMNDLRVKIVTCTTSFFFASTVPEVFPCREGLKGPSPMCLVTKRPTRPNGELQGQTSSASTAENSEEFTQTRQGNAKKVVRRRVAMTKERPSHSKFWVLREDQFLDHEKVNSN